MKITTLNFYKCHQNAVLPSQREGDVGLDVRCIEDFIIPAGKTIKIRTGLILANNPESEDAVFLKVEDRSSMALKGLFSHGGIIDPNYRGEFHVILYNSSSEDYCGKSGDKIAQLVVYPANFIYLNRSHTQINEAFEIEESNRGASGFGSTGR